MLEKLPGIVTDTQEGFKYSRETRGEVTGWLFQDPSVWYQLLEEKCHLGWVELRFWAELSWDDLRRAPSDISHVSSWTQKEMIYPILNYSYGLEVWTQDDVVQIGLSSSPTFVLFLHDLENTLYHSSCFIIPTISSWLVYIKVEIYPHPFMIKVLERSGIQDPHST